jgi:hypothetical protein
LLGELAAGRWRPAAWQRFLARSTLISAQAALARPSAAAELTGLHLVFWWASRRRTGSRASRAWVAASWALAVAHLGLLGQRRSLGLANALTLVRANLPAIGAGRLLGPVALATDLLDGRIARQRGQVTRFGGYADSLADAAFWTWFAARHESSPALRTAAVTVWAAPALAVAAASFARGEMASHPRPVVMRPAAALQAVLVIRVMRPRGIPAWGPGRARRARAGQRSRAAPAESG